MKTEKQGQEQEQELAAKESSELVLQNTAMIDSKNVFSNKDIFEHTQRVAIMLSKSDLVPKQFQSNVGNCIIALEMAGRIGASPLMIMQNLYIVHGRPAWSSTFLIATINACGKFSSLRYEEDEKNGGRTRAWAYDKDTGEKIYGIWVSGDMAKAEGWSTKTGSKWVTMPELMRRYRAATFFARQYAPEISMGIHTMEEIQDVEFVEEKKSQIIDRIELPKDNIKNTGNKELKLPLD